MTRRIGPWLALWGLAALALAIVPGCSNPAPPSTPSSDAEELGEGDLSTGESPGPDPDRRRAILQSVIRLVRDAATNPGGKNFDIATENLNAYFRDFPAEDFSISEAEMAFLRAYLSDDSIGIILDRQFGQRDGRHIEDNLIYRAVAARVAGEGDDLTRVRRVFDWVVRNAMLVPPQSLSPQQGIPQAEARPHDVLVRGMATEDGNGWSERGWLFMALCRQLGLDAGLLMYTPAPTAGPRPSGRDLGMMADLRPPAANYGYDPRMMALGPLAVRQPRYWAVAVLVGGTPYLFDPAIGLPIPSPDGRGVATLDQALTDPRCLDRLKIPGREYGPTLAELNSRPLLVRLETSLGTLSPKMRLLQRDLGGENRVILYRDPMEQVQAFEKAMGARCAGVGVWGLPFLVEYRLFNPGPGNFMQATQYPLQIFHPRWPLLGARLMQLRGETVESIQTYASFRFSDSAVEIDGKTRVAPPVQALLDLFSTYFLALAQMEKGDAKQAKFLFTKALEMLPEWAPNRPYFFMFRWGAETDLGLLYADSDDPAERAAAIRYLSQDNPTLQAHGNLLKARALIWKDPFLPPANTPKVVPPQGQGGAVQ